MKWTVPSDGCPLPSLPGSTSVGVLAAYMAAKREAKGEGAVNR